MLFHEYLPNLAAVEAFTSELAWSSWVRAFGFHVAVDESVRGLDFTRKVMIIPLFATVEAASASAAAVSTKVIIASVVARSSGIDTRLLVVPVSTTTTSVRVVPIHIDAGLMNCL